MEKPTSSGATLDRIFGGLLENCFDRKCLLIALGGGVVGDMAGFAAGGVSARRGLRAGAHHPARAGGLLRGRQDRDQSPAGQEHDRRLPPAAPALADVDTLQTLPARELSAGLAEVIKHGAIADPWYLAQVEQDLEALRSLDPAALARAVAGSLPDQGRRGVGATSANPTWRAILNFGHTFGHAIEAGLGYGQWLHGEAVGCGMVLAADLSRRLGLLGAPDLQRLREAVVARACRPARPTGRRAQWLSLMEVDKKAEQGTPKFVLLEGLGRPPGAAGRHACTVR
jgi:3-dehydroquinate synthase